MFHGRFIEEFGSKSRFLTPFSMFHRRLTLNSVFLPPKLGKVPKTEKARKKRVDFFIAA
jgi:hypothetical protein